MRDATRDIRDIGRMIASANLLMAVRREVSKVMSEGFVVTDGSRILGGRAYDVVVKCGSSEQPEVARRIRAGVSDVDVDRLAEDVLGVRTARRGRNLNGI